MPDPQNARRHTERNVAMIAESLDAVGAARSVVIDEGALVLAGNATVEQAKAKGLKLKVVDVDGRTVVAVRRRGLTPEQKAALAIYDNRAAELAEWDPAVLAQLAVGGADLSAFWKTDELAVARNVVDALAPGRFVAWNIGVSPRTFGAHQVVHLEAVGLTFYRQLVWKKAGVAYPLFPATMRHRRARHYTPNYQHELIQVFEKTGSDDDTRACPLCEGAGAIHARELPVAEAHETVQLLSKGTIEPGEPNAPDPRYQNDVWEIAQSQATVDIQTLGPKSSGLKHRGRAGHALKAHPAVFPVEVPRALITFLTARDELVGDPFGGAGSTLIACEQLGRRARLAELDPQYCQLIVNRWEAFTGKKASRIPHGPQRPHGRRKGRAA